MALVGDDSELCWRRTLGPGKRGLLQLFPLRSVTEKEGTCQWDLLTSYMQKTPRHRKTRYNYKKITCMLGVTLKSVKLNTSFQDRVLCNRRISVMLWGFISQKRQRKSQNWEFYLLSGGYLEWPGWYSCTKCRCDPRIYLGKVLPVEVGKWSQFCSTH